jgi:hypothetical protein
MEDSYRNIMNSIRSSGLHFCLQETPYSCYITVRKSLINPQSSPQILNADPSSNNIESNTKVLELKSQNIFLENSNLKLKQSYQDAVEEVEDKAEVIVNLETELSRMTAELKEMHGKYGEDAEFKIECEKEEKRTLQIKHEKACAEIKNLKGEKADLVKDLNAASVALKNIEKENKEVNCKFKKQVSNLEHKVSALEDYKTNKIAEEKDLKTKIKKADKKLKSVLEREAKIKLSKDKHSVGTAPEYNDDQNNTISASLKASNMNLETTSSNPTSLDPNSHFPTITEDPSTMHLSYLDNTSQDPTSLSPTLETHSFKTTNNNKDPTLMQTTLKLSTKGSTSAITSPELIRPEPSRCELSSQETKLSSGSDIGVNSDISEALVEQFHETFDKYFATFGVQANDSVT